MTTRIGVISDTHGLLRPEVPALLHGCDLIVHGGDIGAPEVITALREIAPVRGVRGNVDRESWAESFPETDWIEIAGRDLYVLHDVNTLDLVPRAAGIDVVISGHSHQPRIAEEDGVLFLNPGSAGPRRFRLPIALAILTLDGSKRDAVIHEITPAR